MKKLIAILAAFLLTGTMCFAADPAEGFWISVDEKTNTDTAGWQIWQEGSRLYGKILSVADKPQDEKATGGEGKWANGYIIDPSDGKRYKCRITFHKADGKKYKGDTLEMRGEVGPFGRSQFWKKATEAAASALR